VKTTLARRLALTSYVGLIVWVMLWIVFLGDVDRSHISLLLVMFVAPLLLPLRGILAGRDKALVWGTLISLLYAVHGGVVMLSGSGPHWPGVIEVVLSLTYLFSASFFVRWRAAATTP
jgi:uncharacterized membrane protein